MKPDQLEIDLAAAMRNGDRDAFKEVYMSFFVPVKDYLRSIVKDETLVFDLAQDTFITLWKKRKSLDPGQGYKSYVLTIARNTAISHLRRKKCFDKYLVNFEPPENDYMRQHIEKDYWNITSSYINELPETHRQVFKLKRWNGLSNKEVAEHLGVSEKTVEYRMTKALSYLQSRLRKHL